MALHLAHRGFNLTVYDIDDTRSQLLRQVGAHVAVGPSDAAVASEMTLMMMRDDATLRAVAFGPDGVVRALAPGALLCDLGTTSPQLSAELAKAAKEAGASFLSAKVAGSVAVAERAELTVFASGTAQDFERAQPVLGSFASSVRLVGKGEDANYLKLVHSAIVGVYATLLAEALSFGEKGGLAMDDMLDVLESGPLASTQLTLKAPILRDRSFDHPPSDIDTAAKDLDILLDAARQIAAPMPLCAAVRQLMSSAQAQGSGQRDIWAMLEEFERLAGIG